jgi:hypothetical protein
MSMEDEWRKEVDSLLLDKKSLQTQMENMKRTITNLQEVISRPRGDVDSSMRESTVGVGRTLAQTISKGTNRLGEDP